LVDGVILPVLVVGSRQVGFRSGENNISTFKCALAWHINGIDFSTDSKATECRQNSCQYSVATVRTGVFANLFNKIIKITGKFENVDEAKSRGAFCQN